MLVDLDLVIAAAMTAFFSIPARQALVMPADIGPGRRVRLAVESIDLLGPELSCRYLSVMDEVLPEMVEEEEEQ